jgi:hypothetical protein
VDIVKQISIRFEGYVQGATKVCIQNVIGTLRVLYPAVGLHQVTVEYDVKIHLAAVERAEEELDGVGQHHSQ